MRGMRWSAAIGEAVAIGGRTRKAWGAERLNFRKRTGEMRSTLSWVVFVVAGITLLIAAVGAILALIAGHARFIEVAWVSIAASLFILAWASLDRPLS